MKPSVFLVVTALALPLAFAQKAPQNIVVKEESGKCVWSLAADKPTDGCPVTSMPGQILDNIAKETPVLTRKLALMTAEEPVNKQNIQFRITKTEVERLMLDAEVTAMDAKLKALEQENKDLKVRLEGDPKDPKKIGITKAIENYGKMMDKLTASTDLLLKQP